MYLFRIKHKEITLNNFPKFIYCVIRCSAEFYRFIRIIKLIKNVIYHTRNEQRNAPNFEIRIGHVFKTAA